MGVILNDSDLSPFADIDAARAGAMIEDVEALAFRAAPCLSTATDDGVLAAAKAILRGTVLRWHETGTASYTAQVAGPPGYPVDPRRERRNLLWPSEVTALQELCDTDGPDGREAFSLDTAPTTGLAGHAPFCDLFFGGATCSCGANLTNYAYPLYEV